MRHFAVGEQDSHHVGDAECSECWEEYPEVCVCGGLVHAEATGQEDEDGNVWVETRCDQCGRSEEEVAEELGREPR